MISVFTGIDSDLVEDIYKLFNGLSETTTFDEWNIDREQRLTFCGSISYQIVLDPHIRQSHPKVMNRRNSLYSSRDRIWTPGVFDMSSQSYYFVGSQKCDQFSLELGFDYICFGFTITCEPPYIPPGFIFR